MRYRAVIQGIDPEPLRVYQGTSHHLQGVRDWARANLDRLEGMEPGCDVSKAIAIIYRVDENEVERLEKTPIENPELKDMVVKVLEDITRSTTKEGQDPMSLPEISDRLQSALKRTEKKDDN